MNFDAHTRQDLIDVIAALEAQNRALREALKRIAARDIPPLWAESADIARAALAATQESQ